VFGDEIAQPSHPPEKLDAQRLGQRTIVEIADRLPRVRLRCHSVVDLHQEEVGGDQDCHDCFLRCVYGPINDTNLDHTICVQPG
jgi:hypothetical protein